MIERGYGFGICVGRSSHIAQKNDCLLIFPDKMELLCNVPFTQRGVFKGFLIVKIERGVGVVERVIPASEGERNRNVLSERFASFWIRMQPRAYTSHGVLLYPHATMMLQIALVRLVSLRAALSPTLSRAPMPPHYSFSIWAMIEVSRPVRVLAVDKTCCWRPAES